ncbi:ABC transporter permease [Microaceticoccus formicicus]|uniref:ABC transporter permease n=1 Tax=Microaceticoccus formicicus TaxID=3118105 RepID=UPI003CD05292|nr:ABC transporter permease [Peptoniphilaceae bacterium AMB_02]
MKNLGNILNFEVKTYLRKKSFIGTTIFFIVLSLIATSIPTIINLVTKGEGISAFSNGKKDSIMVYTADKKIEEFLKENAPDEYEFTENRDEIEKKVQSGEIKRAFVIDSSTKLSHYAIDSGVNNRSVSNMLDLIKKYNRDELLISSGLDPVQVDSAYNTELDFNNIILGRDSMTSFATVYLSMITTYMAVIMYGSIVATSVAREKSDRTMELLITSTSPTPLIIGKVIAASIVAIIQIGLIYCAVYIGLFLNKASYPEGFLKSIGFTITPDGLLVLLAFTFLGYLMYLFLFAGLGALVSKVEDVSTSISPVTIIFVLVYFVTNFAINMPESLVARLASIIPFSSPMAMFARYSLVSIPLIEILISFGLLLLTTAFLAYLSIKIYRLGSLNYGNRVKFFKAIKMIFEK